ncbi:MAG: MFS transporter [Anaerolineae bacterium]|nr:MFS transporter [Anaerolineae bacterium]
MTIIHTQSPSTLITDTQTDPAVLKRGLLVAKSYYFFFCVAIGCLMPFLNVYFKSRGLTGTQIGWLSSVPPLVALVAGPMWGAIADRWQIHRGVLALCSFAAGMVSLLFIPFYSFWIILILSIAFAWFRSPILSIVDSSVMVLVKQADDNYGRQRVWGTIGFVLAAYGLGHWLSRADLTLIFWLYAGSLGVFCAGLGFLMPINRVENRVGIRQGIGKLLGQRDYLSFLIAAMFLGMGAAGYNGFLGLAILDLGGTEQQVGMGWAANALMEIPMMYLGKYWSARYSYNRLILGSLSGYVLVWILIGLSPTPILIVVCTFGIGICFAIFWVSTVGYVSSIAPPGLGATAQALMGAAFGGLGQSLGSVVAGYLWDGVGGKAVFLFAAFCALLAALIFGVGGRTYEHHQK